jgi:hypothetical protein
MVLLEGVPMSIGTGKACIWLFVLPAAGCAVLAGCASTPPPTEQLSAARTMVSQAQPVATRDGAPELSTARMKLARAEDAKQRGDYVTARAYAEQAEVDAKYAWTLAENARMQRAAAEVDQSLSTLRQELDRRAQ